MKALKMSVLFLLAVLMGAAGATTNLSIAVLQDPTQPISDEIQYRITERFAQERYPFWLDLVLSPSLNTEYSLLQYVSGVTCENASVLLVTSPCIPGVLDALQLSRVPTVVLVPEPTCIHGNRPWGDHVMYYPAFLPVSQVLCGLMRQNLYEKVVVVYEEAVEAHVNALEACARSPAPLISTFSVRGAELGEYLAVIDRADLAVPETYTQVSLVVLWADPNTTLAILKQVSQHLSELYSIGLTSRWLLVCSDPGCPDLVDAALPSISLDYVALLHIRDINNTDGLLQDAIGYIGRAVEDLYYQSGFQFNISSSCDNSAADRNQQLTSALRSDQRSNIGGGNRCGYYDIYTTDMITGTMGSATSICINRRNHARVLANVDLFPREGDSLSGKHIRITTIASAPFVMVTSSNMTESGFQGMAIDMLVELASTLNFTYTLTVVPDGQFGAMSSDGVNWTGMVGQLQRKEVDMSVASLSVTRARDTVMDFVDYYYEYGSGLMRKTDEDETKWRVIMLPFSGYVWLCLVLAIPLAGMLAWLLSILVATAHRDGRKDYKDATSALWYTFGAVVTQGGPRLPRSSSGRTFVCSWWAFCIVIIASYGGSLIAYLTIARSDTPFDDLEGLVQQTRYKWAVRKGTVYHSAFMDAQGGVYKDLWDGLRKFAEEDPGVENGDGNYQFKRVMQGDYVYLTDRTPLTVQMIADKTCSLVMLSETFMPLPFGIGLQEGSKHKGTLQRAVKKLRHSGLLQFWDRKWWPKQTCSGIPIPESHAVSLLDAQSAFYLLLAGMVAAMVALVVEQVLRAVRATKRDSAPESVFSNNKWLALQTRYSAFNEDNVINTIADGHL